MTHRTVNEHIREHLECRLGLRGMSLEELRRTQWSDRFEQLMRNRMVMGAYRYGLFSDTTRPRYDNVGSAVRRLRMYLDSGNTEHLVDAANLCLVEFVRGCCVERQVWAPEDDGYHTEILEETGGRSR